MKVIGYARVVPGENNDSALQHQLDRLKQYCSNNSLIFDQLFSEEISGDVPLEQGRKQLLAAIDYCQPEDTLMVVRLDRLSSQKRLVAEIFEHCEGKRIKVAAVAGPQTPAEMRTSLEVTAQAG